MIQSDRRPPFPNLCNPNDWMLQVANASRTGRSRRRDGTNQSKSFRSSILPVQSQEENASGFDKPQRFEGSRCYATTAHVIDARLTSLVFVAGLRDLSVHNGCASRGPDALGR